MSKNYSPVRVAKFDPARTPELIALFAGMKRIDAIACAMEWVNVHNEAIDWHEFSPILDNLRTQGVLKFSDQPTADNFTRYELA